MAFTGLTVAAGLLAVRHTSGRLAKLHVTPHPQLLVLAAGAVVVLAAMVWLAYRYPQWAVPVLVVLMPLRVPVPLGGGAGNLLVPFYLVILAVTLAELVVRDRLRQPPEERVDPVRIALAVIIALGVVSTWWVGLHYTEHTRAVGYALIKLFAFYFPFAVAYWAIYRYTSSRQQLIRLLTAFVGAGVVLGLIGIVQYPTHWVIVNRSGILHEQQMRHAFRVNSLFWDPNIFGRYMALCVVCAIGLFLWSRYGGEGDVGVWRRRQGLALAAAAICLVAFALTFSRSSLGALLIGALVLEMAFLGRKKGLIAVVATVVLIGVGMVGITEIRHTRNFGQKLTTTYGLNKLTGGRYFLVRAGYRMFRKEPLYGVGLGGFPLAFPAFRTSHAAVITLTESHTTPVTMAAEEGVWGIAAYVGLLAVFFGTTLRKRLFGGERRLYLLQAAIVSSVLIVIVHSLSYNAFFEDPLVWLFLALGSAVATRIAVGARRGYAGAAVAAPEAPDPAAPARNAAPTAPEAEAEPEASVAVTPPS